MVKTQTQTAPAEELGLAEVEKELAALQAPDAKEAERRQRIQDLKNRGQQIRDNEKRAQHAEALRSAREAAAEPVEQWNQAVQRLENEIVELAQDFKSGQFRALQAEASKRLAEVRRLEETDPLTGKRTFQHNYFETTLKRLSGDFKQFVQYVLFREAHERHGNPQSNLTAQDVVLPEPGSESIEQTSTNEDWAPFDATARRRNTEGDGPGAHSPD